MCASGHDAEPASRHAHAPGRLAAFQRPQAVTCSRRVSASTTGGRLKPATLTSAVVSAICSASCPCCQLGSRAHHLLTHCLHRVSKAWRKHMHVCGLHAHADCRPLTSPRPLTRRSSVLEAVAHQGPGSRWLGPQRWRRPRGPAAPATACPPSSGKRWLLCRWALRFPSGGWAPFLAPEASAGHRLDVTGTSSMGSCCNSGCQWIS